MLSNLGLVAATEGGEHAGGIGALGINLTSLLLQLATFVIVFLILKKWAFGPILKALEDRRETIEESLKNAEQLEQRTVEAQAEVEKLLAKARAQSEEILAKSHEEAGALIKAAEDDAVKRQERLLAETDARITQEVAHARDQLKSELLSLVADATETLVGERLDPKRDAAVIERALGGRR